MLYLTDPQASGSSNTTRCSTVSHPWRSHRSWRGASCTAHTCPGKWRLTPTGPAGDQNSCLTCWTSSPVSPYRWARCWCQSLVENWDEENHRGEQIWNNGLHHLHVFFSNKHTVSWVSVSVWWQSWDVFRCWHYREQRRVAVNITTSPPEAWKTWRFNRKKLHTHTHTHIVGDVLTSYGGVKAVRGFEISVGIEVENSEPVLQSGSKAVKLCVSAGYTHRHTHTQKIMSRGESVNLLLSSEKKKIQFFSCSLSKFHFISAVYFSLCVLFDFSSNSTAWVKTVERWQWIAAIFWQLP